MTTIDLDSPVMAKHLAFAAAHYQREFSTPQLAKALKNRGLDTATSAALIKKVKALRRGPARKAALIKMASGFGMVALTAILLVLTQRLFWYIGAIGAFAMLMGLAQFVTGVGDRE